MKEKKTLVFLPGNVAKVTVSFKAKKTTVLRIEAIEIDNPDTDVILVILDL